MLETIRDLLACPACGSDLTLGDRVLRCGNGHAFDVAAAGSVTLSAPVGRRPPDGDTAAMVAARLAVLDGGHYAPLVDGIVAAVAEQGFRDGVLADLGSGPGAYTNAVLRADVGVTRAVALDVSAAAVRRAARRDPRIGAVRADVRTVVPVRTGVVDVALVAFAPRNPGEWARMLAPRGRLVVALPGEGHLAELRATGALLDQQPDKAARLVEHLDDRFALRADRAVTWSMPLDDALAADLAGMGPAAHHDRALPAALPARVTGDVHVLTFERGRRAGRIPIAP